MKRWKLLFTIFAVTFTTMLAEVLLTRVFSVVYFGQFAFLIISLALFGYGLSGVFLALRKLSERQDQAALLSRFLVALRYLFSPGLQGEPGVHHRLPPPLRSLS